MNALSSFLARHDAILLFFCSLLFGIAFGLGYERGLVPVPPWHTASLARKSTLLNSSQTCALPISEKR